MKLKTIDWDRLVPVGQNGRRTARWIAADLAMAVLWSVLCFLMGYLPRLRDIRHYIRWGGPKTILMDHFAALIRHTALGFQVLSAALLLMAVSHYLYHYREGRSIYLMRRLPDRRDLWRRCLALPLLGLAGCALLYLVLLLIYFAVYRACTPPGYCAPAEAQEGLYLLLCRLFSFS